MARDRFLDMAASLADGIPIDWDATNAGVSSDADRRLLRQLRVVQGVADLHRSTRDDEEDHRPPEPDQVWTTIAYEPVLPGGPSSGGPRDDRATAGPPHAVSPPPPPPEVWGHLRLLEKLGEGSFGEVYRAHDTRLSRDVALKLLRADAQTRRSLAERLLHEGRALARVHHQNVVTVFGAEERDGRVGLWMELVEGRTLAESVASEGPYSAREAALIGQDLCRALAAVHGAGLVHRDIKGQNVMRQHGGRVVLMDFGAGELRDRPAPSGRPRVTGTPLSTAPEVLAGEPASVRSDIYSLGVLLFYLVTGRFPVEAATLEELRAKQAHGAHTNLHDIRADLPDSFVTVIERAIDVAPERRYASPGAFQRALALALGFEGHVGSESAVASASTLPVSAQVGAQPARTQTRSRLPFEGFRVPSFDRRHLAWLASGVAALVIIAAIVFVWRGWSGGRRGAGVEAVTLVAIRDLRPETEDDHYFADGFTRQLTSRLGEVPGIGVITSKPLLAGPGVPLEEARQRAFADAVPVEQTLRALRADALIEGTARLDPNRASVTLRVVRAGSTGAPWARTFTRGPDQAALLEGDAIDAVAALLGRSQTPRRQARVLDEAYFSFLRGRYALLRATLADVRDALKHFRQAVDLQPDYGQAYAGLAEAYLVSDLLHDIPRDEAQLLARHSAEKALSVDADLAEAHVMLAQVLLFADWDFERAGREYQRALARNPSLEYPRARYAMLLAAQGRTAEAVDQMALARQINPLPGFLVGYTAMALHYAGRNQEAAATFRDAIRDNPGDGRAHRGLCRVLSELRDGVGAIEHCQRAQDVLGWPVLRSDLAQAYAVAGRTTEARAILNELLEERTASPDKVSPWELARVAMSLGEREQALQYLEEAFEAREPACLWLRVDARFDALRGNPRFDALIERLGPQAK